MDCGIRVYVVEQNDQGSEVIPGLPKLAQIGEHRDFGGIWDTQNRCFSGPSENPIVWYCGEKQFEALIDRDENKTRILLYAAEGAGKTVLAGQWAVLLALELGAARTCYSPIYCMGGTAPTTKRLATLVKAVRERCVVDDIRDRNKLAWGRYYSADNEIRFIFGVTIQFRATKSGSSATGSPVQGYTWMASVDDELQDTVENGADPDIEARLRGARVSRRMCTATAKDSSVWREWRRQREVSGDWSIKRIRYNQTPFVHAEHWARMQRNISDREWLRRGEAQDVAPENQVYYGFDPERNFVQNPAGLAEEVTEMALASQRRGYRGLLAIDPGAIQHVGYLLRAHEYPGEDRFRWIVEREFVLKRVPPRQFAHHLREILPDECGLHKRTRRGVEKPVLVVTDKWSMNGRDENDPDRSVILDFKSEGFDIRASCYATPVPGKPPRPSSMPKEASISMVNGLLDPMAGPPALCIVKNERGGSVAPLLVKSLETCERDASGRAHTNNKQRKTEDLSDPPSAIRNGLYPFERTRLRSVA